MNNLCPLYDQNRHRYRNRNFIKHNYKYMYPNADQILLQKLHITISITLINQRLFYSLGFSNMYTNNKSNNCNINSNTPNTSTIHNTFNHTVMNTSSINNNMINNNSNKVPDGLFNINYGDVHVTLPYCNNNRQAPM